jgi:uracil-DNA glycosylase family 4
MARVRECTLCHGANAIVVPPLDVPDDPAKVRVLLLGEQPDRKASLARRRTGLWNDPGLKLLRRYMEQTGMERDAFVYATAVLCVPKDESRRGPRPSTDEARNCAGHLQGILHALRPELVVTLGHTPLLTLQQAYRSWTELRQYILNYDVGRVLSMEWFSVYPLYFPTDATLKARGERRQLQDWQRIPEILESRKRATVG